MIRHLSSFLVFTACVSFIAHAAKGIPSQQNKSDKQDRQIEIYHVQDANFNTFIEHHTTQADNFDSTLVALLNTNKPQATVQLRPAKTPAETAPLSIVDIATGLEDIEQLVQDIMRNTQLPEEYRNLAQQSVRHASQALENTLTILKILKNYNPTDPTAQAVLSQAYKTAFENVRQAYTSAGYALSKPFPNSASRQEFSLARIPTARELMSLITKAVTTFKKAYEIGQKVDKNSTSSIDYLIQATLEEAKYFIQQF